MEQFQSLYDDGKHKDWTPWIIEGQGKNAEEDGWISFFCSFLKVNSLYNLHLKRVTEEGQQFSNLPG